MPSLEETLELNFVLGNNNNNDLAPDEIDELTRNLLNEVLDTDVDTADFVKEDQVPDGTKAATAITLGSIAVSVLPSFLPKLLEVILGWSTRNNGQSIKIKRTTKAGNTIDLDLPSNMTAEKLGALMKVISDNEEA